MTARCEHTQLPLGECAEPCCRPDLKGFQPIPEIWMQVTAVPARPIVPTPDDVRRGNVHALFQVIGGRIGKPEIVEMVRELCEPSAHTEHYYRRGPGEAKKPMGKRKKKAAGRKHQPRYHITVSPPLLVQLYESVAPSSSAEAGTSRPASSRPAARLDAIDTAVRIDNKAGWWLEQLHAADPRTPAARVRRLASLLPSIERCHRRRGERDEQGNVICCTAHQVEADIARWWTWARVETGWDMPAWEPDNTCPLCGVRGSLRIRLVEQLASCINCHEAWDDTTIGLLADHIRHENNEDEEAS